MDIHVSIKDIKTIVHSIYVKGLVVGLVKIRKSFHE